MREPLNGETAVFMGIWVLPNESTVEVIKRVREAMPAVQRALPAGLPKLETAGLLSPSAARLGKDLAALQAMWTALGVGAFVATLALVRRAHVGRRRAVRPRP